LLWHRSDINFKDKYIWSGKMTASSTEKHDKNNQEEAPADFHGAAIIDKDGHEIPITEEMVKDACEDLEDHRKKS